MVRLLRTQGIQGPGLARHKRKRGNEKEGHQWRGGASGTPECNVVSSGDVKGRVPTSVKHLTMGCQSDDPPVKHLPATKLFIFSAKDERSFAFPTALQTRLIQVNHIHSLVKMAFSWFLQSLF